MNAYAAYPHPIPSGLGYWAMIRLCRASHPAPVMGKGDRPKVFNTRGEAAEECLRHMVAFMNGHEIRGERFDGHSTAKSRAALLFKTRPVEGERKQQVRA